MDDLPELRQHVYELLFLPLDERVQEREHSLTTQTIGRRAAGPAYRRLILQSRESGSILSDSQALGEFAATFTHDPREVAVRCGLHHHPLWEEATAQTRNTRKLIPTLVRIMYAVDVARAALFHGGGK